jgi:DinB superfamily
MIESTMPVGEHEGAIYARYILGSLDQLMACLAGMDASQLNWRPPAQNANSIYALAVHTLGNAEESILYTLCDRPGTRDREQEFLAQAQSTAALLGRWQDLRAELEVAMLGLSAADLERSVSHPRRGVLSGREVLLVVARHAAEHLGQAELIRDMAQALRTR